jgi:hypothetical protein
MAMRPTNEPHRRFSGFRSLVRAFSRRRPSSIEIVSKKEGESHAAFTDGSSALVTEVNIVGFFLNPTLLSKHPMADELERMKRSGQTEEDKSQHEEAVIKASQSAITEPELTSASATSMDNDSTTPRQNNLNLKSSLSFAEATSDTIDHCPNVEICLNTISIQEISPALVLHDISLHPVSDETREDKKSPSSSTPQNATGLSQRIPVDSVIDQEENLEPRQPTHRCHVSAQGIELVPSDDPDHCLPHITEVASVPIEMASIRRGRSYIVKSGGEEGDSQVDMESVAVSSLWSSGRDDDSQTSYTGTFSSGSGVLEDDMITAYTGDAGYPSNIYCFAFVDKLDDHDILCIGDDEF